MGVGGLLLVALGIAFGMVGIIIPLVPGTALIVASIDVWAFCESTTKAWVVLGAVVALAVLTLIGKYVRPAQRMHEAGISMPILLAGWIVGLVGFFVIPVVGLAVGFALGVYLVVLIRRRGQQQALADAATAVKAVVSAIGIEMAGAVVSVAMWLGAVLT